MYVQDPENCTHKRYNLQFFPLALSAGRRSKSKIVKGPLIYLLGYIMLRRRTRTDDDPLMMIKIKLSFFYY